jgi:hypothetical protein
MNPPSNRPQHRFEVLAKVLQADLATIDGVDELYSAAKGRPVDALLANAGRGRLQSILTGLFAVSGANNNWTWSQDLMRRSAVYKHGLA